MFRTAFTLIVVLLIFLAVSCVGQSDKPKKIVTPVLSSELSWNGDTIVLALPGQYREFPYRTWSHNYAHLQIFAGFDERLHQINILNTSSMEYEKTIPLHKSGPSGIPYAWGVGSIFHQSKDSIFLLQNTPSKGKSRGILLIQGKESDLRSYIMGTSLLIKS